MKFLQDPVEQKTVEFLSEIQALFTNIVQGLNGVKSNSMQKLLEDIKDVPEMSLTELESFLAGSEKKLISLIVKNGSKKHGFLEENYGFEKNKAVTAIEVDVNKSLFGLIPMIEKGDKSIVNEKYKELLNIYIDVASIHVGNKIKSSILVALTNHVLNSIYNVYSYANGSAYEEILNRFAGLIILSKDENLLNNFNKVFNKSYVLPSTEQGDKPSDLFKVLDVKVLIDDDFHNASSLEFKDVNFASWEEVFKGKNVATKYLPYMDKCYLLKGGNSVYLVEKKNKLIPINLKKYSYIKKELYNKQEMKIDYSNLLDCVMKNILNKKELFAQYSFYERDNCVGMFETFDVTLSGVVHISVFEMGVEKDEVFFEHRTYKFDVSEIESFKPASDLKINLFFTFCEVAVRRMVNWEIKDKIRYI